MSVFSPRPVRQPIMPHLRGYFARIDKSLSEPVVNQISFQFIVIASQDEQIGRRMIFSFSKFYSEYLHV